MGQQQLILILLVTVVVGIMTVVAITMFEDAHSDAEKLLLDKIYYLLQP